MIEWFDIPNGLQITKQIHNGKTYVEILELLEEGESIATYELLQGLRNDEKYITLLGLDDFWVFVPNPDKSMQEKGYVAWFNAYSVRAVLVCDGNPSGTDAALGAFLVRKKVEK